MTSNIITISGETEPVTSQISTFEEKLAIDAENLSESFPEPETIVTGEKLLLDNIKELPCLIPPLLHKVGIACLAGSSDTGKSTFLRQLAIAVATGEQQIIGFDLKSNHGSAIYVSTEDDRLAISMLLQKQASCYPPEKLQNLRFVFDSHNIQNTLNDMLTEKPTDIVIIDCFSDVYGGDLKDSQGMRRCLDSFKRLADKHQCLILFLHHTSKRTEQGEPSKNNLLSGQGFEAKMRLVMELRRDLIKPALRHLCFVKGNYLDDTYKTESFVLQFDKENFCFNNTGDRTPFESLCKKAPDEAEIERYKQAIELQKKGLTQEKIAEHLGYSGKSSVSKLLSKGKENGWGSAL